MQPRQVIDAKRRFCDSLGSSPDQPHLMRLTHNAKAWTNYLVTEDMSKVVSAAASALDHLPDDYEGLLPSKTGFCIFAEHPGMANWTDPEMEELLPGGSRIRGIIWGPEEQWAGIREGDRTGVSVLLEHDARPDLLIFGTSFSWPYLEEVDGPTTVGLVYTTWHLMTQKITMSEAGQVDRAARRQAARQDMPSDVVVCKLRHVSRMTERETGVGSNFTGYSHRFIVDAHWRNQYYPGDGTHRKILILPYVKGPEDKPLVVKDKVNVLAR